MFTATGQVVEKPRPRSIYDEITTDVYCPFCLHSGTLLSFAKTTKKGASEKSFICPECGAGMRKESLTATWTPTQHAEWLYDMVANWHGYNRVKWSKLSERLKLYGLADEFWTAWKAAKQKRKESSPEAYSEYMNRRGEEFAQEQQEQEEASNPKLWTPDEIEAIKEKIARRRQMEYE